MIDFRYHLVSLVSVFLALAVGIVPWAMTALFDKDRQFLHDPPLVELAPLAPPALRRLHLDRDHHQFQVDLGPPELDGVRQPQAARLSIVAERPGDGASARRGFALSDR